MRLLNVLAIFVSSFLLWANVAAELNDGFIASEACDYETALIVWKPWAEQGDAYVQFNLGEMHFDGEVVI